MSPYPKRLIEVDLPIKRISEHARREKSIRHGHISTLHIWWARRPLAACRAVVCAALWPDPADPLCPPAFRAAARRTLADFAELVRSDRKTAELCPATFDRWRRRTAAVLRPDQPGDWYDMRQALLDFIGDFANWDASTAPAFLDTARALTGAAHEALGGEPGTRPLVVDPFAGGGAIPLEALRVGADAFASDLNPVAVLLNKVVLEYIPRYGQRLADEVRKWGAWVKAEAEKELGEFYPKDPDGATPIAYLWARTIRCEGPGCGAEVPLMRSLWLAKKGSKSVALRLVPNYEQKRVDFEIVENARAKDVGEGTVRRASATCPVCGFTTPASSVRQQMKSRRGGAADARMFAVVTIYPGQQGRFYRLPTTRDLEAATKAHEELVRREQAYRGALPIVPDEPLPIMSGVFNAPIYGHNTWGSLFTPRQLLALTSLVGLVAQAGKELVTTSELGLAVAVETCLALAIDKQADSNSSLCAWRSTSQDIGHTFGRQALPMLWDFVEGNILSGATRDWLNAVEGGLKALESLDADIHQGHAQLASATAHTLPDDSADCLFTDPPYYNAVPYADLSDFFYVWLKRTLRGQYPELFGQPLAPKGDEICEMAGWDPERYPHKNARWFEAMMGQAMDEGRRVLSPEGVGVVVFAHKSTSGWEAQLQAMVDAGWTMTGSWPIDTEMGSRLRAINSAVLASSIHLVCRPREAADGSLVESVGDWRDVLQELPQRIHAWLPRLADEGVVGADAIFACLGPALEIFSRYSRVEKASGETVTLREYLEHVWAAVSREALSVIFAQAETTGFEPDARLTAMMLWTLAAGKTEDGGRRTEEEAEDSEGEEEEGGGKAAVSGYTLEYDAARKIAQGLGAHLDKLDGVVQVKGDKARLLPVAERAGRLFGDHSPKAPLPVGEGVGRGPRADGRKRGAQQLAMFAAAETADGGAAGVPLDAGVPTPGATTLDRVHQAMLLFGWGRGEALKRFLVDEGTGKDQRFWTLAQALSALYPADSDEKRWVDGVLARKKGLGF